MNEVKAILVLVALVVMLAVLEDARAQERAFEPRILNSQGHVYDMPTTGPDGISKLCIRVDYHAPGREGIGDGEKLGTICWPRETGVISMWIEVPEIGRQRPIIELVGYVPEPPADPWPWWTWMD